MNQTMPKKQKTILRKKRRIRNFLRFLTFIILIVACSIFAFVSPIFNIKEISVENNDFLSKDTIISLSELSTGQNIFKINKNNIARKIETNAYVENVKIKRKLPNKIILEVTERNRDYNVEFLNGYAYINKQGYILEISEQKCENIPILKGISTAPENIVAGSRLDEKDLLKLETVIEIMSISKNYEIDSKITSIDITDENNFILYIEEEKKEIYLGDKTNLSSKILYIPTILSENKGKEGTIYLNGNVNDGFQPRFREKV